MRYTKPEIDRETAMKLWIEEHSEYAKEQVILNNIGLVGYVLKSLKLNIFDEDLHETGIVGLCRAVNGFDVSEGVKFNTYAVWVIRNEIQALSRKKRIVPALSLDEECRINGRDGVQYAEMISSGERFEELSESKLDFDIFLHRLSEQEKRVVILSMDGVTQKDIGLIIGVSQSSVSRILKRVQRKLNGEVRV